MKIGVFGGTFDPIHIAHLRVAEEVLEALGLDRVLFIPAGNPPHRRKPLAIPAQRLAMVRLAVAGHPRFQVSELEIRRPGKSYTVDTLSELHTLYPKDEFFLILGMDQLRELPGWHEPARLLDLCRVVAISRPGIPVPKKLPWPATKRTQQKFTIVPVSGLAVSATDIRQRARRGQSLRYLVPDAVAAFISRRKLYSASKD